MEISVGDLVKLKKDDPKSYKSKIDILPPWILSDCVYRVIEIRQVKEVTLVDCTPVDGRSMVMDVFGMPELSVYPEQLVVIG